jgi:hypothetical protein
MDILNIIGGGVVSWTTTVSGITGYRTDLASGITAARVPYSAVAAEFTVTAAPSAAGVAMVTSGTALTAVTLQA